MTTVAASRLGRVSAGGSFFPRKRHRMSASAIAPAEIAIRSGERSRRGSDVRNRARNAISTVSQIGSEPELASELDPSRLFHHCDLLFQLVKLHFQFFRKGGLR